MCTHTRCDQILSPAIFCPRFLSVSPPRVLPHSPCTTHSHRVPHSHPVQHAFTPCTRIPTYTRIPTLLPAHSHMQHSHKYVAHSHPVPHVPTLCLRVPTIYPSIPAVYCPFPPYAAHSHPVPIPTLYRAFLLYYAFRSGLRISHPYTRAFPPCTHSCLYHTFHHTLHSTPCGSTHSLRDRRQNEKGNRDRRRIKCVTRQMLDQTLECKFSLRASKA